MKWCFFKKYIKCLLLLFKRVAFKYYYSSIFNHLIVFLKKHIKLYFKMHECISESMIYFQKFKYFRKTLNLRSTCNIKENWYFSIESFVHNRPSSVDHIFRNSILFFFSMYRFLRCDCWILIRRMPLYVYWKTEFKYSELNSGKFFNKYSKNRWIQKCKEMEIR